MSIARSFRVVAGLALVLAVSVALGARPAPGEAATGPAFEPVQIQRINLPARIREASTPIFTRDGRHLLFFAGQHLWIVGDHGASPSCLSCGLANQPTVSQSEQEGFATEFPDGRRVFFGAADSVAVLECRPSVVRCAHRRILPVDLSGASAKGSIVPAGGADMSTAVDEGGAAAPKLAPDGTQIAFSDVRSDVAELMIIATLKRTATTYVTSDPRVINPPGPASPADPDTRAWSDSSGLFEFKSFADGGADATYVQVGGDALANPDVWEVNLATGKRTRLTANPDWDEDDAPSPDGRSIVIESDRGMHRVDMFTLMPVRGFVDDPAAAILSAYLVGAGGRQDAPQRRQCDLQPWLLPAAGDHDAELMGQPLQPYTGGTVHPANNVAGYPTWDPDGTAIALNTQSYRTNRSAPYLLVARLVSRRPTKPLAIVSSEPGKWAPAPDAYHGPIGAMDNLVLRGLAAGTATVDYDNTAGLLAGTDRVTYRGYSDNGRDFVTGTYAITNTSLLSGPVVVDANLKMTGADTGYTRIDATFGGIDSEPDTVRGTASSNYDGTTVSGIPRAPRPCPSALPRRPRMRLIARLSRRGGQRLVDIRLTATVRGAGLNEARLDTRPVTGAIITLGRRSALTGPAGRATLAIPAGESGRVTIHASAGDTLAPTTTRLVLPSG